MIEAVIFDLDGLLIDSEPLWREGESRVFQSLGMPVEPEDIRATMGMRLDEAVHYWHGRHPWQTGHTEADVMALAETEMVHLIGSRGEALPGAVATVALARQLGCKTAIASSSTMPVIEAALGRLQIDQYVDIVRSASGEPYGKPHPAVYLTTAHLMGVAPTACIAFEDSIAGTIAAKAARMICVSVPDVQSRHRKEFGVADAVLDSLLQATPSFFQQFGAGEAIAHR